MTLWLRQIALDAIAAESRRKWVRETGGALFGYRAEDGDIVVTRAFGPGKNARHRAHRLVPDREATQEAIDGVHRETGGAEFYVGEWHTHPFGSARPSGRDIASLVTIAEQREVGLEHPVAVIQATRPLFAHLRLGELAAFELRKREVRQLPVKVWQQDDD